MMKEDEDVLDIRISEAKQEKELFWEERVRLLEQLKRIKPYLQDLKKRKELEASKTTIV